MKYFLLAFLFSNLFTAQNISFIYELKYRPGSEQRGLETEEYYLDILDSISYFRSEEVRRSDSLVEKTGYGLGQRVTFNEQLYIEKNEEKNILRKFITTPVMRDQYFINIEEKLNWDIQPDQMKIGELFCQMAQVNYGGRKWTVWFSRDIPLPEGPYVFSGLPGLIIKATDEQQDFDFNLIRAGKSGSGKMFAAKKGKEISWETYQKIQLDFYGDPYAEIKARNIKFQFGDDKGNIIPMDLNAVTKNIQKQFKQNNNPIELDTIVQYP